MCSCEPGFVCSRCQGTRQAPDYLDTDDREQPEGTLNRDLMSQYEMRDA